MPNPVALVTVHHEGAGNPCSASQCSRFAGGGYTYGIGTDGYNRFRDVWSSYATLNYNHVSLDLCLSGNRMTSPVTNSDIAIIRQAVGDARARGYVVDNPTVRAHRNSPGSSTVCPGDYTMARWNDIVAACTDTTPAPSPTPTPQPEGAMLTTVACNKTKDGRRGTARPIPAFGTVQLDNGASLHGDVATADPNVRVWANPDPMIKQTKAPLLDIAATVDAQGRPDGWGIVALYNLQGRVATYQIQWS